MSDFIDSKHIHDFFSFMNDSGIQYMLIKNIAGELPERLLDGKDIDIIVKIEDREKFSALMGANGFLIRLHPLGTNGGWTFAYNLPEYQFWQKGGIRDTLYIDCCFKLMCKSLTPKFWVPLDETIQRKAWSERNWNETLGCWQMGQKSLFVYILARCVFDKHVFSQAYVEEIERLKFFVDDSEVKEMLKTIFYKFTSHLIQMVKNCEYDSIVNKYITFVEY